MACAHEGFAETPRKCLAPRIDRVQPPGFGGRARGVSDFEQDLSEVLRSARAGGCELGELEGACDVVPFAFQRELRLDGRAGLGVELARREQTLFGLLRPTARAQRLITNVFGAPIGLCALGDV